MQLNYILYLQCSAKMLKIYKLGCFNRKTKNKAPKFTDVSEPVSLDH